MQGLAQLQDFLPTESEEGLVDCQLQHACVTVSLNTYSSHKNDQIYNYNNFG